MAVIGTIVWFSVKKQRAGKTQPTASSGRGGMGNFPVPIIQGTVEQKEVPIYLDGLGTVQAFNTVTVHSRVDGQVIKVAFVEGQDVHTGDVLAQIDPAPFQAQLDQSIARKAQDEAQLAIARLTLTRDKELLTGKILSQQDYDTQQATVNQLEATVRGDQAAIDNANVQLSYTTITSPLDGRTGIRMIDQGNIVHANDSNGLVVITQLRPISVTFTLAEQNLPQIRQHQPSSGAMTAIALDRDNRATLSEGKLAVIDNQIDITTGTIRLKAVFPNEDLKLWPGQFVNVRLLLETRQGPVVPASVVQHGPDGDFAFVITGDMKAEVRPIKVAQIDRGQALIQEGLSPGELVVVDGQYKLQAGSKVKLADAKTAAEHPGRPSNSPGKTGDTP
ncbi:MAG TPA: efflux RND transporter periplasmic adaptor subunit [Patescibacteria group bacterium]|nr:efflux RND transporter periplasmic adaptor subunit [Patescibacteria group bacterium]